MRPWRVLAVLGLTACAAACGGHHQAAALQARPAARGSSGTPARDLLVVPALTLSARGAARETLPRPGWDISFDAALPPQGRLRIELGRTLLLERFRGGQFAVASAGQLRRLKPSADWPRAASVHVEATNASIQVDGVPLSLGRTNVQVLQLEAFHGTAHLSALIISSAADRAALLLHRLAELHARLGNRDYPLGSDLEDHIHIANRYWTTGFWPGALWQAAAWAGEPFLHWALAATVNRIGGEAADTHDVGFIYEQSSLAAWLALCRPPTLGPRRMCTRLRASGLRAAGELLRLAQSNQVAGTVPTVATSPEADTIIDSMMNVTLLPWASRVSGNPAYRDLAYRHARIVASLLVRRDGSTAQSVVFDRLTGTVLRIDTHQGMSATSTWARGEGWALYGFADLAYELHSRWLLRVALRIAAFVASHLPRGAVPHWDYDAGRRAPVDVSAGAITAAGMFHLALACRSLPTACGEATRWVTLGRELLASVLRYSSGQSPIGLLQSQVMNERAPGCWCNGGELIYGIAYALEAHAWEQRFAGSAWTRATSSR